MLHFFSESLEVSVKDNKICHLVFTDVVSFMACVKKGENIYNGKRKIGKKVIKKKETNPYNSFLYRIECK